MKAGVMPDDESPLPVEECSEPGCCNPVRPPTCRMYAPEFDAEVWHLWTDFSQWALNRAVTARGVPFSMYPEDFEVVVEVIEELDEVTLALGEPVVVFNDEDDLRATGVVVGARLNWSGDAVIAQVGVPGVSMRDACEQWGDWS